MSTLSTGDLDEILRPLLTMNVGNNSQVVNGNAKRPSPTVVSPNGSKDNSPSGPIKSHPIKPSVLRKSFRPPPPPPATSRTCQSTNDASINAYFAPQMARNGASSKNVSSMRAPTSTAASNGQRGSTNGSTRAGLAKPPRSADHLSRSTAAPRLVDLVPLVSCVWKRLEPHTISLSRTTQPMKSPSSVSATHREFSQLVIVYSGRRGKFMLNTQNAYFSGHRNSIGQLFFLLPL